MTTTQIPYLPPEMLDHILKRSDSSTLQTCLEIKYLAEFAQKELDKRYQRCLEILIELEINEIEAKKQLAKGEILMYPACMKVTDTSVTALANNCSGLTTISLHSCSNITDASVVALAEHCPGLTKIDLGYCRNITDTSVMVLAKRFPMLTTIGGWLFKTDTSVEFGYNTTDRFATAIVENFRILTAISLNDCSKITDTGVTAIADNCPGLSVISLRNCSNITDASVVALAHKCPGLTWINLVNCSKITDTSIITIAQHCPGLIWISLRGCSKITDAAKQLLHNNGVNVL